MKKITKAQIRELAQKNGRKGGKARAKSQTKEQLSAIGKTGAAKRWGKEPTA